MPASPSYHLQDDGTFSCTVPSCHRKMMSSLSEVQRHFKGIHEPMIGQGFKCDGYKCRVTCKTKPDMIEHYRLIHNHKVGRKYFEANMVENKRYISPKGMQPPSDCENAENTLNLKRKSMDEGGMNEKKRVKPIVYEVDEESPFPTPPLNTLKANDLRVQLTKKRDECGVNEVKSANDDEKSAECSFPKLIPMSPKDKSTVCELRVKVKQVRREREEFMRKSMVQEELLLERQLAEELSREREKNVENESEMRATAESMKNDLEKERKLSARLSGIIERVEGEKEKMGKELKAKEEQEAVMKRMMEVLEEKVSEQEEQMKALVKESEKNEVSKKDENIGKELKAREEQEAVMKRMIEVLEEKVSEKEEQMEALVKENEKKELSKKEDKKPEKKSKKEKKEKKDEKKKRTELEGRVKELESELKGKDIVIEKLKEDLREGMCDELREKASKWEKMRKMWMED